MALMLGVGVLGDDVNQVLNPTAPEIVIDKPEIPADDVEDVTNDVIEVVEPTVEPDVVEPDEPTVPEVEDTVEPAKPVVKPVVKPEVKPVVPAVTEPTVEPDVTPEVDENVDENEQTGDVEMPKAAYGTEASGAVAVRMVAAVEESKAYAPVINDKGSKVLFYTEDDEKLYQWQSDLKNVAEPTVMLITEEADAEFCDQVLVNTTAVHTMNTIVFAPDNTWMAINSRGDQPGIWLSADNGKDLWQLCTEGGGDLLAWAPNSSKFLFTDGSGKLYAAYPIEQRIFLVSDLVVTDIAWAKDSTTVAFVANTADGYNAVYTVEIP